MNQKKIFISYSKHDIRHKETLLKHLSGLRDNVITWNDRDIQPGEEWDERIKEELHQADVVLYLVSANSMATDYIQKDELPLIEARCQRHECVLIPIIVDFCFWAKQYFAKYNVLPEKGVPVPDRRWTNENEAWLKVIEGIERIISVKSVSPPQQPYLKPYADDVVIHAATADLNFAETFRIELHKHLAAKLGGFIFRLRLQTNQDDFSQAATVVILLSGNYLQQYDDDFQNLPQLQQKRLVLVDVDKAPKPASLEEVMEYGFCQKIRQNTVIYQATDSIYQSLMGELVVELGDLLQKLKNQEPLEELKQANSTTVFINVAPEDRDLGEQIKKFLDEHYDFLGTVLSPKVIKYEDIDNMYRYCEAVLFIYVNGSESWGNLQLLACNQAINEQHKNFKITAIYTNEQQLKLINAKLPQLKLQKYLCPPYDIQDYLPRFVEALK